MTLDLPPMDVPSRLDRLRGRLDEPQPPAAAGSPPGPPVDALLVTGPANLAYLTGFTGSAGLLLVGPEQTLLLTDGRYRTQSAEELEAAGVKADIEIGRPPQQREAVARAATAYRRLGLESDHITWGGERALAGVLPESVELVPTSGLVEGLRRRKDAGEVARMAAAAGLADAALSAVRPRLAEHPTEAELALALDHEMRRLGAEDRAFQTIVAAGRNGAKPHARPTDHRIEEGELVVVDFGATVDGYRSDMTRTLCLGPPRSRLLAAVVEVVAAAQAAGLAAVAPGVAAATVDAACRQVITGAGWAEAFSHGTGHGVGLDVHEAPSLSAVSDDLIEEGAVVTVEPGAYLPDHGGARIEDTVAVTAGGCQLLTRSPRDVVVG